MSIRGHKKSRNRSRGSTGVLSPQLISGSEGSHIASVLDAQDGEQIGAHEYRSFLSRSQPLSNGVALYVHLPFCPSRCLSCEHITSVSHNAADIDIYLDHLDREFEMVAEEVGDGHPIVQLYLGGGTPNYLSDPQLLRLMDVIERYFRLEETTEATLEAAPKRSSQSQLQLLRGLGFKGIKFEVRDLDLAVQKSVGRSDSFSVLEDVFTNARDAGFATLSMDFVYGLPQQTVGSVRRSIKDLLDLSPDRLVCSAFSRKPEVFDHHRAIASPDLPSLADRLIMFNAVVDEMEAAGYTWIGLDSFALETDDLALAQEQQRLHHNWMGYNSHGSPNLLGFGASAISEVGNVCVQNHLATEDWSAAIEADQLPVRGGVRLGEEAHRQRSAVSGLLCNMELSDYADATPSQFHESDARELEAQGVLRMESGNMYVTDEGRYVLHHYWNHGLRRHRWVSGW